MMPHSITLCFHGIGRPPLEIPDEERPYWITEGSFASFISGASSKAKELGVDLRATFDDGNRSDLEIAAPILAKYGVMGTFFPCSGRLTRDGYLTADDIRNLFSLGFEIGSHGVDHVPWTKQDAAALHRELVGSKAEFEQILGASIHAAAIPFGAYNRRVLAALKAAGYAKVYNSDRGFGYPGKWITRRWTYNSSEIFDLEYFVAKSSSVSERILVEAKGMIKSLR